MTEAELKRKLVAIEAMRHGATSDGERAAAKHVFERLKTQGPRRAAGGPAVHRAGRLGAQALHRDAEEGRP